MKKIFAVALFAVLFASLNVQAQSVVNKNSTGAGTGVTSFTVTLPSVSSGNLLTVGVGWCGGGTGCGGGNASSNTMTVSDSAGNTLTVPSGVTLIGDALASSIAQGVVTSASSGTDTFTIHFSSAVDYPQVSVSQISPPSGYSFSTADGNGTTAYTTGSSLSISLTTSNAEDLLYSFTWDDVFNAGSGQTTINQNSGDGVTDSFVLETSSGSHSMSYSAGSYTGTEAGSMTAYKLTSGGGGGGEGPYGGTAASIPGTVQAENYDTGGDGVGYNASSNGTGNSYRSDGDDLEATSDTGGGYDLGWTASGQWFRYTVDVSTAGTYTVDFRVASLNGVSDAFHIADSSGDNLSGSVNVPDTGDWQNWTDVTATVSLPAGTQVLTLDQDNGGWNLNYMTFTSSSGGGNSPDCSSITPTAGTLTTSAGTWSWGNEDAGYPADWRILLNGSDVGEGLEMEVANGGQMYIADEIGPSDWWVWTGSSWASSSQPNCGGGGVTPNGVSPPSGHHWTTTFDDEFTNDSSVNTTYWNGAASNTDWCNVSGFGGQLGGSYMFREPADDPCVDSYAGVSLNGSNGLQMTSPGYPSAAIQTGGPSASSANFIQEFGYWEASFKVPNMSDSGYSAHSDFWMHPIPEGVNSVTEWAPEIDVGERPTWLGRDASQCNNPGTNNNTQMWFSVAEGSLGSSAGGYFGDSAGDDMSNNFHTYGMWWNNDGSGPYGSIQFYLDGTPLLSSPFTLSSNATNMANGIYMFLSLDQDCPNDSDVNAGDPFIIQYVRVWRLDSN